MNNTQYSFNKLIKINTMAHYNLLFTMKLFKIFQLQYVGIILHILEFLFKEVYQRLFLSLFHLKSIKK